VLWLVFVLIRISMGAVCPVVCSRVANFLVIFGDIWLSVLVVVIRMGGYDDPFLTLCSGEYW